MPEGTLMSGQIIQRIDDELGSSTVVRTGFSAYASLADAYDKLVTRDKARALRELTEGIIDLAARLHRQTSGASTELLTFSDGANECLFDATNERTVLMHGLSKTTPPNSRDNSYHGGYPRAGDDHDKGHALSHAQGGLEGGRQELAHRAIERVRLDLAIPNAACRRRRD